MNPTTLRTPAPSLNPAHVITASRGLAGFGVIGLLWTEANVLAFFLYIAAIATDLVDGMVARKFGQESTFGLWLDAGADKLLAGLTWIGLAAIGWAPLWMAGLILVRNLIVAVGWTWARASGRTFEPHLLGRLTVSFEGVTLPFLLLHHPWAGVHWASAGVVLGVVTLSLSVGSAILYALSPPAPRETV